MIDQYIRQRLTSGARPATVNRETQLLAQAIRPFLEKHRLPVPPIRKLPEDNTREVSFREPRSSRKLVTCLRPQGLHPLGLLDRVAQG